MQSMLQSFEKSVQNIPRQKKSALLVQGVCLKAALTSMTVSMAEIKAAVETAQVEIARVVAAPTDEVQHDESKIRDSESSREDVAKSIRRLRDRVDDLETWKHNVTSSATHLEGNLRGFEPTAETAHARTRHLQAEAKLVDEKAALQREFDDVTGQLERCKGRIFELEGEVHAQAQSEDKLKLNLYAYACMDDQGVFEAETSIDYAGWRGDPGASRNSNWKPKSSITNANRGVTEVVRLEVPNRSPLKSPSPQPMLGKSPSKSPSPQPVLGKSPSKSPSPEPVLGKRSRPCSAESATSPGQHSRKRACLSTSLVPEAPDSLMPRVQNYTRKSIRPGSEESRVVANGAQAMESVNFWNAISDDKSEESSSSSSSSNQSPIPEPPARGVQVEQSTDAIDEDDTQQIAESKETEVPTGHAHGVQAVGQSNAAAQYPSNVSGSSFKDLPADAKEHIAAARARELRNLFLLAWVYTPEEEVDLLGPFSSLFVNGKTVADVALPVDDYCWPLITGDKQAPLQCLRAKLVRNSAGRGEMTAPQCPDCRRKRQCYFALPAPGVDMDSATATIPLGGGSVRWVLKKRRQTKHEPANPAFFVGPVRV